MLKFETFLEMKKQDAEMTAKTATMTISFVVIGKSTYPIMYQGMAVANTIDKSLDCFAM